MRIAAKEALSWLEITPDYRCNHRCVGCGATDRGPSLSPPAMLRALDTGRSRGASALWLGGGEPTLRRDLLWLIRRARERGFTTVRLQTNGAMLAYREFVARLRDAGVTEIAASIKGPDAATHDRWSRAPGAFDLLLRGIENARQAALPVEGDILVYRSTTPQVPSTVETFFARGVARFRLWLMAPPSDDSDNLAQEPRWAEVAAAVRAARALSLSPDPTFLTSLHSPPCTIADEDATARFFAPALRLLVHDASDRSFMLEDSPIEGGTYPEPCGSCRLKPRCNGVRKGYLRRHGTDELKPR